jgi:glyoxylase-like metal-dependent hydrolase (beta-lactamase superfamily II)
VKAELIADAEGTFATLREAFPALHSDAAWWIPVNVTLLRTDDATILVDTGAGPKPRAFFPDGDARLLDELARAGVTPEEVDVVVHTHLHVDHVGWTGAFPNARYVVHEDDWAYFMSEESLAMRPHLRERILPLERVERVTGETEVSPGVVVQPTPGHTPGHISVRSGELAILGDMVAHELQVVDPDVVFVNDMDPGVAAATRRRVIAELAGEGTLVTAGHLYGRGRFERAGKGFRWAVE